MSRQIKFTPFGVPYIREFDHVSVVPPSSPTTTSSSSFCYIDTPPPPPPSRLPAVFNRKHAKPLTPSPQPRASETQGICIRFPPERIHPPMTRSERLVRLQQTISNAVLDAGMSPSPDTVTHPERDAGYKSQGALFCGTYGQMVAALEGAGLSATPYTEENSSRYTRLGALFVARSDGTHGVQLRKITLWG